MKKYRSDQENIGYLLIAPFYLFIFFLIFLPIVLTVIVSFTFYDISTMSYAGIDHYKEMFHDGFFQRSILNTVIYTVITVFFTLSLGLILANLLNTSMRGIGVFRTVVYFPQVISMVAVSMIWLWMYDPANGVLNLLLDLIHIPRQDWLFDVDMALGSLIVISIWKFLGYNMVIYLAGLQTIPTELYEAARIDGASRIQQFFHITIPLLKPITTFLLVTGVINNFNVFEQVLILTEGGPASATTSVVHQIYDQAFMNFRLGYASAQSVFVLFIVGVITAVNFAFARQKAV